MSNNTNETKKPLQLNVTEPEKFESIAATLTTTTQKLAKRINKLFSTAFVDYHGSYIQCVSGNGNTGNSQQFIVELHFKPVSIGNAESDGRVRAFKPIEEINASSNDIVAGIKNIYGQFNTSARFALTEEAAQILSEFMLPGLDNGKNVDPWKPSTYNGVKFEYVDNAMYGQTPIMVKITGLDLIKIIRKIYGTKNSIGNNVDYGVIPFGPVNPNINNQMVQQAANWRLMLMQVDAGKTWDFAAEMGYIPTGSATGIITGF
jgi:hypothetical protein